MEFLRRRCSDTHTAEDLAHDALLRVVRFRGGNSAPRRLQSWAVQIAANVHRDHVRRSQRCRLLPDDDPTLAEAPAREEEDREEGLVQIDGRDRPLDEVYAALRRSLAGLELRDRTVIDAYYGEGGSTLRAARATGVPSSSVKVRLFRARRRLAGRVRWQLEADRRARLVATPDDSEALARVLAGNHARPKAQGRC